ncbi:methyltransferase domain-containing protein [Staphylococcus aureus]|uniref:Mobile element protein n=30 Tax=Bacilli TaxID=91061 RepID=A0A8B0MH49_STAAU|nr:class I SAM-dependent methyltransferase [Staphylococcus aureus]MCQ9890459.1 methyltransferase domain-containing protein [Staphylococcus aureus]MCQ9898797.1 methyltransferase domain-containing protein [Staphylococcus aureus]MCQ9910286.1 methyltransferase domain-containing protein [Staphylococcus aureus]MCQ9934200.1 methyltransferase domain-containing protein [Staphylococcus aureus]MCQ9937620.1 methyltransferase domain-containing protein [Staphylococcus aureus]
MKENKYDDNIFFQKYSQMSRSQKGLAGAGEWETLKKMLPDFKGKRVLDLGCGYGWHCIYAMENGASSVVGVDISHKMLDLAKSKRQLTNTVYLNMNAEQLNFNEKFDFIVSRTTFHHLDDIASVIQQMKELLNEEGRIVILDNVSEVETPPTYVYKLGAIQEFLPHCFKFGIKNAIRIYNHNTSKSWLEHLASDKYLSEQNYYDLYEKLLPGCQFHKMGWAMGVVWTK